MIFIPQPFSKPMSYESATRALFIQSFFLCFLQPLKVRLIDYLTECVNQSINTWMGKRCSFYAVNNNKIIITNKWYSVTRILNIHHSFIHHLLLFLSRECMIEGLNRCLFCMLLSIQVQQTTRQIRIATTMKLVMQMDINIVDW